MIDPVPVLMEGIIISTANAADLVDVVIPAFDEQQRFNDLPCNIQGAHGPSLGAHCLVGRDVRGGFWVVSWYGGNSDQEPHHSRPRSDRSGQTDHGSSAVDARGVAAPSGVETWTNVGSHGTYPAGSLVPIAPWIKPVLTFAVDHGWDGTINEGWRSLETQKYYWDNAGGPEFPYLVRGVNVAPPGTSNHGRLQYPGGAIDINDTGGMAAAMAAYHETRKLVWFGPKDTPHWSGNGR